MTYFLMLLFVFVTLFVIAVRWLSNGVGYEDTTSQRAWLVGLSALWSVLGTFFFHNMW